MPFILRNCSTKLIFGILTGLRNPLQRSYLPVSLLSQFSVKNISGNNSRNLFTMKLESEKFKSIFTPELNQLLDIFQRHQHEIRVAGGAVRDLLMDIQPSDLDFATVATPEQMKEIFTAENIRMINMTGEKHGTITARINDKENFEITTLRIDVVNHGRHADVVFTQNWELDSSRRDLTINSMFLGFDGTVYDYFGGFEDLKKRRVAFVGNAETRIQEDYLRILRYFRFSAKVSLDPTKHEPETQLAIKENIQGLAQISGERIWIELKQILTSEQAGPLLETMLELGIAPHIGLPEELNMEEFRAVWKRAKENNVKLQAISLLATLMDTPEEAIDLRERLKYTTFEKELSIWIVQKRDTIPDPLKPIRPYQMMVIDNKNKLKDTHAWTVELLRYQGKLDLMTELENWVIPKFPVSGHDLKNEGVPGGKSMNMVMQRLKNAWKASDFEMSRESLIQLVPDIIHDLGMKAQR